MSWLCTCVFYLREHIDFITEKLENVYEAVWGLSTRCFEHMCRFIGQIHL